MLSHPRNVRSRTPRPIALPLQDEISSEERPADERLPNRRDAVARGSSRKDARRAERARRSLVGTPTPPPVAITIEPASGPDSERRGGFARGSDRAALSANNTSEPDGAGASTGSGAKRSTRPGRVVRRTLLLLGIAAVVAIVGWAARTGRLPVANLGARGEMGAAIGAQSQQIPMRTPELATAVDSSATAAVDDATPADATPTLIAPSQTVNEPEPRPTWRIRHEGHYPIKGGVLHAPSTFVPEADGSYDLIVHFHGNTWAVRESVEQANINAVVAIINLGIGSAAYREAYEATGTWEALLEQIDRGVKNRGVPHPKLRRIALSAWSAGYGAVGSVLTFRAGGDPIDAILVEDGIHASWKEEDPTKMKPQVLRIFAAAAREAAAGHLLFTMTHSAIDPPTFAGTAAAAKYLLHEVGATPNAGALFELPAHVTLACCEHAVSARREQRLIPTSDTTVGELHIRGYTGETKEHHMAHLLQMAATVLPELRERWSEPTEPLRRKIEL